MSETASAGWRRWEDHLPRTLISYIYTGLFCLAIGIGNWMLDVGVPLWASLGVSFCIGYSINTMFVLFGDICRGYLSPYLAPIPLTAIGLLIGLLLAGWLIIGQTLYFFTENFATLVIGAFFGIVGFLIFSTRERLLATQASLAEAQAEQERQEKLILQTELKLLQAQIEPHFLFNTLSNIAALIHDKPDIAEKTLLNLTTLLRASLSRTREAATTLAEELEIARAYLDIHKTRMQDRMSYEIEAPGSELSRISVPPLLVQPLVENAIKHGLDPKEENGTIRIYIEQEEGQITITVADDGAGIDPDSRRQPGTGLANVRNRLAALYGDKAGLRLLNNSQGGVDAVITLPIETVSESNATERTDR